MWICIVPTLMCLPTDSWNRWWRVDQLALVIVCMLSPIRTTLVQTSIACNRILVSFVPIYFYDVPNDRPLTFLVLGGILSLLRPRKTKIENVMQAKYVERTIDFQWPQTTGALNTHTSHLIPYCWSNLRELLFHFRVCRSFGRIIDGWLWVGWKINNK